MTEESSRSGDLRSRIVDDYSGYKIYDREGGKLGKVEYTVLDEREQPQYLAVKTGLFGSKTSLIPERIVRLDESAGEFQVEATESQVKDAPAFGDEDEIPPDFEERTMSHYGLGSSGTGSSGYSASGSSTGGDRGQDPEHERTERGLRESELGYGDRGGESRGGDGGYNDQDYDRERGESSGGSGAAAAGAGAAGAAAASSGRDRDAGDSGDRERRDEGSRGSSGFRSGTSGSREGGSGEREQVRVTLKREEARAERFINEHGEEEVRIRKTTVKEEKLVDVEDLTR